tara:strand:- start:441 stop:896 length:456 start_codon:yes stop_codon:yes gene_type:complete
MPKFYRQNKKRIDPRYFLNETVGRDLDEGFGYGEHMSSEEALRGLESDLYDMEEQGQMSDDQRAIVNILFKQLDKHKCGRVKVDMSVPSLPPQEIKRLAKLSANKDMSTFFRIAAELVGSNPSASAADSDNDGIADKDELAIVDRGELPRG